MCLADLLKQEFKKRVYEEGFHRIERCLAILSEDDVWSRPNDNCNSVGNLILHLNGNVTQWITTSFGKIPDTRQRGKEFYPDPTISKKSLLILLQSIYSKTFSIIEQITTEDLENSYLVQGFNETGASILVHVIEHFSYHVGQITLLTKIIKNVDTGYYAGINLDA